MSTHWKAQMEGLLTLGYEHEPAATARFVSSVDGPNLCGYGILIAFAVEALPDSCRALAEPILALARACGATDEAICTEVTQASAYVLDRRAAARVQDDEERLRRQHQAWGQCAYEYPDHALMSNECSVGRSGTGI